jgi:hypothetical protein
LKSSSNVSTNYAVVSSLFDSRANNEELKQGLVLKREWRRRNFISGAQRSRTTFNVLPLFPSSPIIPANVHEEKQGEERDERCQLPFEPSCVEDKTELTHHQVLGILGP